MRREVLMTTMSQRVTGDEGQGLAEYGLILAFIALVCIAALTTLGTSLSGFLNQIAGSI